MLQREPLEFFAGDSVKWRREFADYTPAGGWILRYLLRGPVDIDLEAEEDGNGYAFALAPADTAAYAAGVYAFSICALKVEEPAGEGDEETILDRVTLETGRITVKANPTAAGPAGDALTENEKILKALKAAYAGGASQTLASYTINGTAINRMSRRELETSIDRYEDLVSREKSARLAKRGKRTSTLIKQRF